MFIKKLLNRDVTYFIFSFLIGIFIFNFLLFEGHFLFLDTSTPWSIGAWKLWLNDHIFAWNNMLGGGYPRTTYFSQGISFLVIDSIISIFGNLNLSFFIYYLFIFGLGTFFGYKFINLYIENKKISFISSLFIFINPFSIQWINLYVFYIALFGLSISLFSFIKFLRTNKFLYLLLFGLGTLFLFTYQRFIFSFIFIFAFVLLFEYRDKIKELFTKKNLIKYIKLFLVIIGINAIWLTPILLNKFDGEKTTDGYENHLNHNNNFEKENIYNSLNANSNLVNFININDKTNNYNYFFQKYHGENNIFLLFPLFIFGLAIFFLLLNKNKNYKYIFIYLLIIYFLLMSFKFLNIGGYSNLVKIIPALNVTHFYFQLSLIPIFALLIAFILSDLGKIKIILYIFIFLYFSNLVYPLIFGKDIYINKNYNEFKLNNNCQNYNNFETLIYPFGLKSIGHISNDIILSYFVGYNNCIRIFNFNIYQNSTFHGKIERDNIFSKNFLGFDKKTLEKYNIGEIILLNEKLFNPKNDNFYLIEYNKIKKLIKEKKYKLIEKNKYFEKYKIFEENKSWTLNGIGNISIFPENYSKYFINIDKYSKGNLIFKESYHKKWKLYKTEEKFCDGIINEKGLKISNNNNYNKKSIYLLNELKLFGKNHLENEKIKIINGYQTSINLNGLKGCYIFYFKPQLYYYIGLLISILTSLLLTLLILIQEFKIFRKKRYEK